MIQNNMEIETKEKYKIISKEIAELICNSEEHCKLFLMNNGDPNSIIPGDKAYSYTACGWGAYGVVGDGFKSLLLFCIDKKKEEGIDFINDPIINLLLKNGSESFWTHTTNKDNSFDYEHIHDSEYMQPTLNNYQEDDFIEEENKIFEERKEYAKKISNLCLKI